MQCMQCLDSLDLNPSPPAAGKLRRVARRGGARGSPP